jgi:hypothetical protein
MGLAFVGCAMRRLRRQPSRKCQRAVPDADLQGFSTAYL